MTKSTIYFLALSISVLSFTACNSSQKKQKAEEQEIVESVNVDGKLVDDFKKSKLIFYSLLCLTIGSCFSVHYRVMEHAGSLQSTKET